MNSHQPGRNEEKRPFSWRKEADILAPQARHPASSLAQTPATNVTQQQQQYTRTAAGKLVLVQVGNTV